jgi:hypothetical protein
VFETNEVKSSAVCALLYLYKISAFLIKINFTQLCTCSLIQNGVLSTSSLHPYYGHDGPIIHNTSLGQQVSPGTSGLPEPGNKKKLISK